MRQQLIAALIFIRTLLRKKRFLKKLIEIRKLKYNLKVVLGASGISQHGWLATEHGFLNILIEADWSRYFEKHSINRMLAEHVWEHMTVPEGLLASQHSFNFLADGGSIRIAVPDGLNPDLEYINAVKPNGTGPGARDHKVLYTHDSLGQMLESVGFVVRKLVYFDEKGQFHIEKWNVEDGLVRRSLKYDPRNTDSKINYTSLIIDAIKIPGLALGSA